MQTRSSSPTSQCSSSRRCSGSFIRGKQYSTGACVCSLTADGLFSIYDGFSLPQASWIALLSISHRYEFLNVYERAIREIYGPFEPQTRRASKEEEKEKEDEKEKEKELQVLISVAEKYDVPLRNVVPLLVPFVVRARPLTEGEVLSFSALTVSRLAHAREEFREAKSQSYGLMGSSQAKEIVYRIWQVSNDG